MYWLLLKKWNDFITMERTKMAKWLYYCGTEEVLNLIPESIKKGY